jgi:pimeloyl-ACP methyl ester carboxylesterase
MSALSHVRLGGGPVEYQWLGPRPDAAPTLVLLHEGLGSVAQWKDFPELLARLTGLGVMVYSRFGYGGSGPISLPRPLDYMHHEAQGPLPELLAALNISRHLLIGHSDGATIALLNAALAPASGLAAVVAEAPHVFVEEMTVAGIRATFDLYGNEGPKSLRQRLARYHADNVDNAFHGWAGAWLHPDFRAWDIEAEMAGIRVPTLLIQGRQDEYASLEQLDRIERRLSGSAERFVVEDCGHSPHLQHPDQVAAAMAEFAKKVVFSKSR